VHLAGGTRLWNWVYCDSEKEAAAATIRSGWIGLGATPDIVYRKERTERTFSRTNLIVPQLTNARWMDIYVDAIM
jgi:hypothetical protein